jgi:hypothetical protein
LRGDAAAEIGYCIRQAIKIFMCKTLNQQFDPDKDKKDWDGKDDGIKIHVALVWLKFTD